MQDLVNDLRLSLISDFNEELLAFQTIYSRPYISAISFTVLLCEIIGYQEIVCDLISTFFSK